MTEKEKTIETLLKTHRDNDSYDFDEIWSKGIFIFDSNVLLDMYRLPKSARDDLTKVLSHKDFKQRIWIAQQVLIEFLNNRIEVISDQKTKYSSVKKILEDHKAEYNTLCEKLSSSLDQLKLKKRHSAINPDEFLTDENIQAGIEFIDNFLKKLNELEEKQSDVHTTDLIKPSILKIFEGKIGEGLDKEKLLEIYTEGKERYDKKIPPGYKDNDKDGSYRVGEKEYIRKYGDLILWNEIIEKAVKEKSRHIVLVTGDSKEDWWLRKNGKTLGPRKEILNEIYTKAPDLESFYMYETSTFLSRARDKLNINVKDSTITETKNLFKIEKEKTLPAPTGKMMYIDIRNIIEACIGERLAGRIRISDSLNDLPMMEANLENFAFAVSEILDNIRSHARHGRGSVLSKVGSTNVIITFRNRKTPTTNQKNEIDSFDLKGPRIKTRKTGLTHIYELLQEQDINTRIISTENVFIVKLYIPTSKFLFEPDDSYDDLI